MGADEEATVLIVDDERAVTDAYAAQLRHEYDVRTAYGGVEAIEMLASDLDVVLLDRRMPIVSGNEVLAEIEERGLRCRVAMVTAVDPDFDIIDMGCDDYIVKPVTRDEITEVVDRLVKLSEYNDRLRELSSKKLKRNVLEVEKTDSELAESDTFQRLQREISEMEETIEGIADELGSDYVTERS